MRMLSDREIADRIFSILKTLPEGERVSTSMLFRQVCVAPEELLPVGSLLGIHNLLMEQVAADPSISLEPDGPSSAMPQHAPFILRSLPR